MIFFLVNVVLLYCVKISILNADQNTNFFMESTVT